jgi:hypothetical protein
MAKHDPMEWQAFVDLSVELDRDARKLCGDAYAAWVGRAPPREVETILGRIDAFLSRYEGLLATYAAGRREALLELERYVVQMREYRQKLTSAPSAGRTPAGATRAKKSAARKPAAATGARKPAAASKANKTGARKPANKTAVRKR